LDNDFSSCLALDGDDALDDALDDAMDNDEDDFFFFFVTD